MPASVTILVDVHEQQSGIPDHLEALGATVEVVPLAAGDYAVGDDTLVERKRVLDLHAAIVKGRLWPQLGKLRTACMYPYLLVEGTDLGRGPVHANAIRGACLAVIDQGIALLRSDHQRDTAEWLYRLAVRCQRVGLAPEKPAYAQRPKAGTTAPEAALASIPGISVVTARALLRRFGTLAAVLAADPKEWRAVEGVGPKRARALHEALTATASQEDASRPRLS